MLSGGQRYQVAYCELADGSEMNGDVGSWQAIVYHGLGQLPYHKQHPLVQQALKTVPVVCSLQLPYHGWESHHTPYKQHDNNTPHNDASSIFSSVQEIMLSTLKPIIQNKRTIIITYSGAGVWIMKLFTSLYRLCNPEILNCIFIGAGFSITEQGFSHSVKFYSQPSMLKTLECLHYTNPQHTIIPLLIKTNNPLSGEMFMSTSEIQELLSQYAKNLYFICGEHDQVYQPHTTVIPCLQTHDLHDTHLHMIDCDHYSFFSSQNVYHTLDAVKNQSIQWMRDAIVNPSSHAIVSQSLPTPATPKQIIVDKLLGTWLLKSFEAVKITNELATASSSPSVIHPAGVSVEGTLSYTADGYVSVIIVPSNRRKFLDANPMSATPQDLASGVKGVIAYSGYFVLHDNTVTHYIKHSLFPNWQEEQQQRYVNLEDDDNTLVLSTDAFAFPDGALRVGRLVWDRANPPNKTPKFSCNAEEEKQQHLPSPTRSATKYRSSL